MSELVRSAPKAPGLYAIVEDCPLDETVGVATKVGGLDGFEDWCAVVHFGHFSPSLEIALELLGESDGVLPEFGRGDHVVNF